MGSPPPSGLKKEALKLPSVNNIVIPPANTGNNNNNKNAVTKINHHINKGTQVLLTPAALILKIVLICCQDRIYVCQMQTKNFLINRWPRVPHTAG